MGPESDFTVIEQGRGMVAKHRLGLFLIFLSLVPVLSTAGSPRSDRAEQENEEELEASTTGSPLVRIAPGTYVVTIFGNAQASPASLELEADKASSSMCLDYGFKYFILTDIAIHVTGLTDPAKKTVFTATVRASKVRELRSSHLVALRPFLQAHPEDPEKAEQRAERYAAAHRRALSQGVRP